METSKPILPKVVQTAIEETVGLRTGAGRCSELAERMGMTEGVLRNKIASEKIEKRHHLTLAEAIALVHQAEDRRLITAICKEFKGQFLPFVDFQDVPDSELLANYTKMMMELGQFSNDIHLSLADGKITQTEIGALRKDFLRLSGALSEIMDRLQLRAVKDQQRQDVPRE
jgi:hypothetical protein